MANKKRNTGSEASNCTHETKNETGGNITSKSPRNWTGEQSEEEEVKENNSTSLTKKKNVTGKNVGNKSSADKSKKRSQENKKNERNRASVAKENNKTDENVRSNNTGNKTRYLKKDNKQLCKKSLARGSSTRLGLGRAVVVSLAIVAVPLIVAVCARNLDCGAFYDSVKASINVNFSGLGYIFDLITASTNTGFCNPHKNKSCDEFLLQKIKHLALKYNDQSSYTWLTLFAAAHDHVSYQPNPERPIVIMVYRLKDGSRVTEILEDIAEVYDSVLPPWKNYGNITIDGKSFTNSSPEETQKQIQDMLENGFEKQAQKVAIVYDFDKLPSCSVLTFNNYCNNEDAPHKDVAIILTVTGMDENFPSNPKSLDLEEAVSKLLHEKWKDCPEDLPPGKIDAVLGQVANNVILLR